MRFRLFNPNSLAQALLPATGWLFSRAVFYAWLLMMLLVAFAVLQGWDELVSTAATDLVSRRGLLIFWCVFPVMKLVHELAHALAIRRFGGQVHEFGLALLVLMPVPYVDGSDSVRFSSKYQRMAVAAAGIFVETTLAALGLLVWFMVEPGWVRDTAFVVFVTGSVSSLLFNGNPLLKFDAYYILCDYLEIPNLSSRSTKYPLYLINRYVFGIDSKTPSTGRGERRWLLLYGVLAGGYRLGLTCVICLYVATHYFFVGVAIAVWALALQVLRPAYQATRYLLVDRAVAEKRLRVGASLTALSVVVGFLLFGWQVPHVTSVRGVIWPDEQSVVRVGSDCFVAEVYVQSGQPVASGEPLLRCEDEQAEAQLAVLKADHLIARASLDATRDRADREILSSRLAATRALLDQALQRGEERLVTSAIEGEVFLTHDRNLVGRYFKKGESLGFILNPETLSVRTLLKQERVDMIGDDTAVDARLLDGSGRSLSTQIARRVPAATTDLLVPALTEEGGGDLATVSEGSEQRLAMPVFEMNVALPTSWRHRPVGEPIELRFTHGRASLATLMYREAQLLLLRHFHV